METDKDAVTAAVIVQQVSKQGRSYCTTTINVQQAVIVQLVTDKDAVTAAVIVQQVNKQGRNYANRHCSTGKQTRTQSLSN